MSTLEQAAPDFAKKVVAVISAEVDDINGIRAVRHPNGVIQRSANGQPIRNGPMNPVDVSRVTQLSRLAAWIDALPITNASIYALARRQAYVHGDISEWTPTDRERDLIARYGQGTGQDSPEAFLTTLADGAWREVLAFAKRRIAELEEELAATDDERAKKLRDELKTQKGANKLMVGRMKRAEEIAAKASANDELKAKAAELAEEHRRLLEQINEGAAELAAALEEPEAA